MQPSMMDDTVNNNELMDPRAAAEIQRDQLGHALHGVAARDRDLDAAHAALSAARAESADHAARTAAVLSDLDAFARHLASAVVPRVRAARADVRAAAAENARLTQALALMEADRARWMASVRTSLTAVPAPMAADLDQPPRRPSPQFRNAASQTEVHGDSESELRAALAESRAETVAARRDLALALDRVAQLEYGIAMHAKMPVHSMAIAPPLPLPAPTTLVPKGSVNKTNSRGRDGLAEIGAATTTSKSVPSTAPTPRISPRGGAPAGAARVLADETLARLDRLILEFEAGDRDGQWSVPNGKPSPSSHSPQRTKKRK
ncbi:hypothetical protein BC828DRAFT_387417 [Blastocladiella britannica]|nr:hypothetical protein BC828DRAFT_387417 [Blastocladiella britannica]